MDREPVSLTPEEARARRRRNVAIGIVLVALVILFYVVSIAKLKDSVVMP